MNKQRKEKRNTYINTYIIYIVVKKIDLDQILGERICWWHVIVYAYYSVYMYICLF